MANKAAEPQAGPEPPLSAPSDQPQATMVVGIGASAGGLAALRTFFAAVAPDLGVAFVVIVHLHPDYPSELATILKTYTPMPVVQVAATVPLEPNHVYVIPPNQQLFALDNQLSLADFQEQRGLRMPIDYFFRSLAETHGDGLAIVLSGGGSDGSTGLKAVKERGGLVLVQEPSEAEYSSMPRSAIATGLADLVLPLHELAARLPTLIRSKRALPTTPTQLAGSEEEIFRRIVLHMRTRTGHDFNLYKRPTVLRRIERRLQIHGLTTLPSYLDYLYQHPTEVQALFEDMLISVTSFFRDPWAFTTLATQVLPTLFTNRRADQPIRLWVPGCATGEEAYSLAILLAEQRASTASHPEIQIFASDLDEAALVTAREGRYPESIAADVTEARLQHFFIKEGGYYRVKKELRDLIVFATHSLLKDPPFARLDLLSCRNLLIYLDRSLHQQLFTLFHYTLQPGGYLFLGSAESVEDSNILFHAVNKESRIYQRQELLNPPPAALPDLLRQAAPTLLPAPRLRSAPFQEVIFHRQALEAYGPPSILVDADFNTVHLSEQAGRYLQPPAGRPTHYLPSLVRPALQLALQTALQQAFEHQASTLTPAMPVQFNGAPHGVQLFVRPLAQEVNEQRLALVVFLEGPPLDERADKAATAAGQGTEQQVQAEFQRLQAQLQSGQKEYATSLEELRAANEELQSINEEYRSTAEELETSKEELQSINEELQTVNLELKLKLAEISQAHSDLQNFMTATEVGMLFLDLALRIRRFTPQVAELFHLLENDQGRALSTFRHSLIYPTLEQDARAVLDTLIPREHEVAAKNGRGYLVRLRPYRSVANEIAGLVITFVDVTARQQAEAALRQSEERYRLLVEGVPEYALFLLDPHGLITSWNSGAEHIFQYSAPEVLGQSIAVLFTEEDRQAARFSEEMAMAVQRGHAEDERWHVRKDGSTFWASGLLTALPHTDGSVRGFAKVLRDNTERKQAEQTLAQLNASLEQRVVERTTELAQRNHELDQFVAIAAHDLRTPLRGIKYLASWLTEDSTSVFSATAHDYLAKLGQRVQRLEDLLNELLAYARTGRAAPEVQRVDTVELVNTTFEALEPPAGFTLQVDETLPHLLTERAPLATVFRNLLNNAIKHHDQPMHGSIHITAEQAADWITFSVADNGPGLTPAFQAYLVPWLQRPVTDPGVSQPGGLGLTITKKIVESRGGQLSVASQVGVGTTFHFTWPTTLSGHAPADNERHSPRHSK